MKIKNKDINETIYNTCTIIHSICKLNVEFIGNSSSASFQLINSQIPPILTTSNAKTLAYIHNLSKDKLPTDLVCHLDNFQLSYIAIGFFEHSQYKGTIITGPFLSAIPDDAFISKIIETNQLSLSHRLQLHEYYKSLSIFDINDIRNIGSLIINLISTPFIHGNILFSQDENLNINKKGKNDLNDEELFSAIELRYRVEKSLLNAVEKGSKEEALRLKNLFQFAAIHRVPNNPLRAYKNLSFSFNTLLRIASERGGVSPIYIHNLSDKFAILIENISSIAQLETLQINMVSEYCDLVNKFSTAGYSKIISKTIDYINLNFDNQLSLSLIAKNIDINASHLSRQFKKETNMTVTEFINKRRIQEAKFLIDQNNNSITEIALLVGYENHNYFCKVFKQITTLTPKDYLKKSILKKEI